MKKREPEDEQLCIAVHPHTHSIISLRHIQNSYRYHTALHNMGAHLGSPN